MDVLQGKDGQFRIQTNYSTAEKQKVFWPDSTVNDYLHRHEVLEDLCIYEFVARYKKMNKKFKQMDTHKKKDDANIECVDEIQSELCQNEFRFKETHPENEFSHLRERKRDVLPQICLRL